MIGVILNLIKLTSVIVLILAFGHIEIKGRSVSNHIGSVMHSEMIQNKIKWISSRVDFTNGFKATASKKSETGLSSKKSGSPKTDANDKGFLSAIFKD